MWRLLLLFSSVLWAQTPGPTEKTFTFPEFRDCGLVTRYSSNKISPTCLQSANNLLYDEDFSLLRRNGYAKYNATGCTGLQTVRGLWKFDATDGTHYMVVLSSNSLFQTSGEGSCTMITGLTNLSSTAEMECVQTLGKLWCVNGVDGLLSWDGASTQAVSGAPIAAHIGAFRNRVLLGDISGSRTRIRGSGELDGTDWTLFVPGKSTTSFSIDMAGTNDGNNVSCMMGEFQGAFVIGRQDDLQALYGYDRRDFTLRKISKEIGCIEPKSVQEKNNSLYWLSKRGVERYTGTSIERASDPIRPTIDGIIQTTGNTRTKTFSSQGDFTGGNAKLCPSGPGSCASAAISPGNIVVSTWGGGDTSASNYALFASSLNISTSIANSAVTLAIQTMTLSGVSDFTGWTNYFVSTAQVVGFYTTAADGACNPTVNYNSSKKVVSDMLSNGHGCTASGDAVGIKAEIYSSAGSLVASESFVGPSLGGASCSTRTMVIPDSVWIPNQGAQSMKIRLTMTGTIDGGATRNYDTYPVWFESPFSSPIGNTMVFSRRIVDPDSRNCYAEFTFNTKNHYFASGNFVSRTFDTSLSTPTWGPVTAIESTNTATAISLQTQSSSNGTSFDSLVSASLDNKVTSSQKRYIRYKASFTQTNSTETPTLDDISLTAATTAYYISDCATPPSTITGWNAFLVNDVQNGGSFNFWTSTGTTCAAVTALNANWVAQLPNAPISNATSTFIAARVLFNIDSATQTPTLNDMTFSWNEGTARPPTASAVYRDRYWLFYTTSTLSGTHNDHAVVADSNDKWSLMDDINAYSATIYNRKLYTGESTATGFIYQQDIGSNDNGNSFAMTMRSADIDLGNPAERKILKTVYVYLHPPTDASQTVNPTFTYYIDGSTVPYSLGTASLAESPESSGYFVAKLPVPASQPSTFHWFSLGMDFTGNVGPLRIYGIQVIYEPVEWK